MPKKTHCRSAPSLMSMPMESLQLRREVGMPVVSGAADRVGANAKTMGADIETTTAAEATVRKESLIMVCEAKYVGGEDDQWQRRLNRTFACSTASDSAVARRHSGRPTLLQLLLVVVPIVEQGDAQCRLHVRFVGCSLIGRIVRTAVRHLAPAASCCIVLRSYLHVGLLLVVAQFEVAKQASKQASI